VARIEVPSAEAPIVAGLLPFVSEARVAREGLADGELAQRRDDAERYAERLCREISARAAHRDPAAVNVMALHQFVTGGAPSDSERRLRLGALSDLDASAIPAGLDYVALGHHHRPQRVAGAPSPALYAGSPIAYSFSEAGQDKRAVLVDVAPGRPATISDVLLRGGRPLEIWAVRSLEEARDLAASPRERLPIVEVRADLGRTLGAADGDALFALPNATVLAVRDLFDPHPAELAARSGDELPEVRVEQLFRELWTRKHSEAPDDETLEELRSALLALGREGATPLSEEPT
jgi:exonuclease SbcD